MARTEELEEVAHVLRSAYSEYLSRLPEERHQRYLDRTADVRGRLNDSELYVAERNGRVVGTITLFPNKAGESVQGWPEGWTGVRVLGVLPEARGLGIGRALVEHAIGRSRELAAVAVGLHTTEMMEVARALYERMGFVRVPEYDFSPSTMHVYAYRYDLAPFSQRVIKSEG